VQFRPNFVELLGTHRARLHRVRPVTKTKIVAAFGKRAQRPDVATDPTLEFSAESAVAVKDPDPKPPNYRRTQILAVVLLVGALGAAVYWANRLQVPAAAPQNGTLRIETDSPGAEVRIDGTLRGVTPLSLTIVSGQHNVAVQQGTNQKQLPVSVTTGEVTAYHLTWTDAPAPVVAAVGNLSVTTDTPGGEVTVDGEARGAAPLTVRNLTPGQHRVVVKSGSTNYTRTVQIEAGSTASLVIGANGVTPWGWISIATPVSVQVFEGQRLIGTSDIEKIMLTGGDHDLEFVSEPIGFRAARKVRVGANQTTSVALEMPKTAVSINALPWADVSVDGTRVGETPLGNVAMALGPHEIIFRHPQLGERRVTKVVTLKDANRVSMDMRSR
jgi:PEGA domain-containing protein